MSEPCIAVVVKGYPRLSETFIANELHALEKRGVNLAIVSLRKPSDTKHHAVHDAIKAPVLYLPEYLHEEPLRVARAAIAGLHRPGFGRALRAFWRDFLRDPSRNRVRRFGQALVIAAERCNSIAHLHAHFMHTPGSVARYTAILLGLRYSLSAHARDIWTTPPAERALKLSDAAFTVTCTAEARAQLAKDAPASADRIHLVYHGVDAASFTPAPQSARDGTNAADPVRILSIGRLVEKKGYDVLLRALVQLPHDVHWRFTHLGGGPLATALIAQAASLGLADRIAWRGAQSHDAVRAALTEADLFALACRTDRDGDRDGLPNVLLEAAASALPIAATRTAAIAELVADDANGILVDEGDANAMAAAVARLSRDPALRARLAAAARETALARFSPEPGYDRIAALLRAAVPHTNSHAHCILRAHEAA